MRQTRRPARFGARAVWVLVLLILGLVGATVRPARSAPVVRTRTLDNGLTVVVEERPTALTAGVSLAVRAGVRDDNAARSGEVALLARALLGGTPERPSPRALAEPIRSSGGALDLVVDVDLTRYNALVPAGDLDDALGVIASMLLRPLFGLSDLASATIETASGTYYPFDDDLAVALWPGHPAGRPSGGTARTRAAITYPSLLALRDRLFGASNMALAVVGPVQAEDVFGRVAALFGPLPAGRSQPLTPAEPDPPNTTRRMFPTSDDQATVTMVFPTPGRDGVDAAAVQLLTLRLSGPSGLLFQELRSNHGLARDVDAFGVLFSDVGAELAVAQVQPSNVEETVARFAGVFDRLRTERVTEETLAGLRDRLVGELLLARQPADRRASELAGDALLRPDASDDAALMASLRAVTPDDLQRVARRYFAADRAVVHILMPGLSSLLTPRRDAALCRASSPGGFDDAARGVIGERTTFSPTEGVFQLGDG